MADVDDWDWDDPLRDWEGKQEPDCFDCLDSHPRGCPGCDPTRWRRLLYRLCGMRVRAVVRLRRATGLPTDESPF